MKTFDEAFEQAAIALFDARAALEIFNGEYWEHLCNQELIDRTFQCRRRACELASPAGIRMSNGMSIRFKIN